MTDDLKTDPYSSAPGRLQLKLPGNTEQCTHGVRLSFDPHGVSIGQTDALVRGSRVWGQKGVGVGRRDLDEVFKGLHQNR